MESYMEMLANHAKHAAVAAAKLGTAEKNKGLCAVADELIMQQELILAENQKDLKAAEEKGVKQSLIDRLALSEKRIADMAEGLRQIASLDDPVGEILSMKVRPNGLRIGQKRVPLGVVGIIYESRPNVTADAFGLCFKTGNAVILRGGSDAIYSNQAIVRVIKAGLRKEKLCQDLVLLVEDTSREVVNEMMKMHGLIDVLIPRGGAGLIANVVANSTVPVIETGTGNCHVYVDETADISMAADIIENADLSSDRYLYRFGEYITENELGTARRLRSLPEETIQKMADVYTEGYRIGFINTGKDLSKKSVVNIRYSLGFERVIRAAIAKFRAMGLKPVIYRAASGVITKREHHKIGYFGAVANWQYEYDHRQDQALFMDKRYIERRLEVMHTVYEQNKEQAAQFAGPAVMETFGEKPFSPKAVPEAPAYCEEQRELALQYDSRSGQITNEYIKGEERSFTIIAYPVPEIGPKYEEIFDEVIRINTLDAKLYEKVQQTMIDALDQGEKVRVIGKGENRTDMEIRLWSLKDARKETIFENCVADVNIPVGEVFTSPVLEGTNGVLHVSRVYLDGLQYKDLELKFKDGKIVDYRCGNFKDEEEGRRYIFDNVLKNHDTLPLGEFAIGTNTTAYAAGKKYGIEDKMPILIAEKTGPHFAVGDTCYSWSEDVRVYNPNGKEIVAKDNSCSLKRKEDPSAAYFQCHTDITVPYEELEEISVVTKDGKHIILIKDGRFVLPGTEILNEPLKQLEN